MGGNCDNQNQKPHQFLDKCIETKKVSLRAEKSDGPAWKALQLAFSKAATTAQESGVNKWCAKLSHSYQHFQQIAVTRIFGLLCPMCSFGLGAAAANTIDGSLPSKI